MKPLLAIGVLLLSLMSQAQPKAPKPLLDMREMLDASTLDVKVLKDWYVVRGQVATRQKLITIRVVEMVSGKEYRVPVRMIVPAKAKANIPSGIP